MTYTEDHDHLKGVARSLENIFSQVEAEYALLAAEAAEEVRATAVRAATVLGSERTVKALRSLLDEKESPTASDGLASD
jgi:HEAT repeat protein